MATPCRRKRSGAASQTVERSKKSKVRARAATDCTASGDMTSVAWTIDSTRPRVRPSIWLATRRTAMTSATSPSTAATISLMFSALLAHDPQDAVAGLREGREVLERLERGRQAATVAFVVPARGIGGRVCGAQCGGVCGLCHG